MVIDAEFITDETFRVVRYPYGILNVSKFITKLDAFDVNPAQIMLVV